MSLSRLPAALLCVALFGCTQSGGRRGADLGSRSDNTAPPAVERALLDYLWRAIERARKDRTARARLPAACPSPLVDWEALQLSELHSFATLGIGDGLLLGIAKPRQKGPADERTCSAKIAFRFRDEPRDAGKPKIKNVWLSDQPEPQRALDDEEEDDENEEN